MTFLFLFSIFTRFFLSLPLLVLITFFSNLQFTSGFSVSHFIALSFFIKLSFRRLFSIFMIDFFKLLSFYSILTILLGIFWVALISRAITKIWLRLLLQGFWYISSLFLYYWLAPGYYSKALQVVSLNDWYLLSFWSWLMSNCSKV